MTPAAPAGRTRKRAALLVLALLPAAASELNATQQLWRKWLVDEEPIAQGYRHTKYELAEFNKSCAELAPAWAATTALHASLERLVVMDVRHLWHGVGDSFPHWVKLLRLGRTLSRASFLWIDPCADRDGPTRPDVPSGLCRFDPGAYVQGLGGLSWRWTAERRRAAEAVQPGGELALVYACHVPGQERCVNSSIAFANGSLALHADTATPEENAAIVLDFLHSPAVATHPWLRIVLPHQAALMEEAHSGRTCALSGEPNCLLNYRCAGFATWRPRPRVWAALRPALQRMEGWRVVAALTVRTGLADHFDLLAHQKRLQLTPEALVRDTAALFHQCPAGSKPLHRERAPGAPPCVNWVASDQALHIPDAAAARRCDAEAAEGDADAARYAVFDGPLGVHVECAWRRAAALARDAGEPASWGVLLFSDSPALNCALEASPLAAAGHAFAPASMPGHNRYAPPGPVLAAVGLGVIADFYLLALATPPVHAVFTSAFSGVALSRTCHGERFPRATDPQIGPRYPWTGYEQWFRSGRDKVATMPPSETDEPVRALLAATHEACPEQARATAAALALYEQHLPAVPRL